MRINKYIASCGVASRRKAEELIISGRVTINGELITELSTTVDETKDIVEVDGVPINPVSYTHLTLPTIRLV